MTKEISTEIVVFFPLAATIWCMPRNLFICVVLQTDSRHGQFLDILSTDHLSHAKKRSLATNLRHFA